MKFAIYKTSGRALRKAGAAVLKNGGICKGFTLLEVMVVVIVIGILASLAYSSLTELIFINRAKETAQTIRTFTERALMDGKRMNKEVTISISGNKIIATDKAANKEISSEIFGQGFLASCTAITGFNTCLNTGAESQVRIGLSGISGAGYFAACFRDYCGGAAKLVTENSFKAYIKKGANSSWEAL